MSSSVVSSKRRVVSQCDFLYGPSVKVRSGGPLRSIWSVSRWFSFIILSIFFLIQLLILTELKSQKRIFTKNLHTIYSTSKFDLRFYRNLSRGFPFHYQVVQYHSVLLTMSKDHGTGNYPGSWSLNYICVTGVQYREESSICGFLSSKWDHPYSEEVVNGPGSHDYTGVEDVSKTSTLLL